MICGQEPPPRRCPRGAEGRRFEGADRELISKPLSSTIAIPAKGADNVKLLSLYHRFVIALHSPDGVFETGLLGCPPEKMAAKLACSIEQDTFSGPG
jgi:hypothetical protein